MKLDHKELGRDVLNWTELALYKAVVNFHGHIDVLLATTQEDFVT